LVLLRGHTPGNSHDQHAKPGEGLRCCVCLHTRYVCSLPSTLPFSRPSCPPFSSYVYPPPLGLFSFRLSPLLLYIYFSPSLSVLNLPSSRMVEKFLRRGRHAIT
uniref:Ovule protein n=1 Tax=Schistocephalus solidus TaxID=70667 RepID=A0A183S8Z1_SCHSO